MNVSQIKTELKAKGVEFNSKAKKDELVALLEGNQPSALTEPEPKKKAKPSKEVQQVRELNKAFKAKQKTLSGAISVIIALDNDGNLKNEDGKAIKLSKAHKAFLQVTRTRKAPNKKACFDAINSTVRRHHLSGSCGIFYVLEALRKNFTDLYAPLMA